MRLGKRVWWSEEEGNLKSKHLAQFRHHNRTSHGKWGALVDEMRKIVIPHHNSVLAVNELTNGQNVKAFYKC